MRAEILQVIVIFLSLEMFIDKSIKLNNLSNTSTITQKKSPHELGRVPFGFIKPSPLVLSRHRQISISRHHMSIRILVGQLSKFRHEDRHFRSCQIS